MAFKSKNQKWRADQSNKVSREFRNASKTKFTTDNSNKIFAAMQ